MALRYLQRTDVRRRDDEAVNRGMNAGAEVGKLLGGLAGAIKGAQKDALANKMMTEADIAGQPGAGQKIDLGKLPDEGSQSSGSDEELRQAMAASQLSSSPGQPQDLGQLPDSSAPMTPSPGGSQQPMPDSGGDDQLRQALAASRLGGGPTVGSLGASPSGGPQPAAKASSGDIGDFALNPSDYSGSGGKTVGSVIHTGGTQELELQKEMLAMQMQKANMANSQESAALRIADARAKAAGTGPYALDAATRRANLAKAQAAVTGPKATKTDKNPPPVNINEELVTDQGQLTKYVDDLHGKGTMAAINSAVASGSTVDAQGNPVNLVPGNDANGNPLPPVPSTVPIQLNKSKSINIPLATLQTYVKQQNGQLLKQNQPLNKVPGEDQSVGATADNPYPAKNKLDAVSRAHKTWVRLPNGQIAQVK